MMTPLVMVSDFACGLVPVLTPGSNEMNCTAFRGVPANTSRGS